MTTTSNSALRSDSALWLIGGFKIAKGGLLVLLGLAAQRLLHEDDIAETVRAWAMELHVRPEGRFIGRMLARLSGLDPHTLQNASAGIFVYAALLFTEGIGLVFRQRWAEYFTIIMTGSFIPLEMYELTKRATIARVAVAMANAAIVGYLVLRLRRETSMGRRAAGIKRT